MNRGLTFHAVLLAFLANASWSASGQEGAKTTGNRQAITLAHLKTSPEEQAAVRNLIEQLVFADERAKGARKRNPGLTLHEADGKPVNAGGDAQKGEEHRKRLESCQAAFQKLAEFQIASFPLLIKHLDDKRPSINFRNHQVGNSVGDACKWNIYFQLADTPDNYSNYGYSRRGRDGKSHPKPAWDGTPFDDAGGVRQWLEENKGLTYVEMQIKCLSWFLDKEQAIGASDAESYFTNILPLEIRILERRRQAGENVDDELTQLRLALAERDPSKIPSELLPSE